MTDRRIVASGSNGWSGSNAAGGARRGSFKTGCLVVVGIILVLLIGGGIYAAMNWKNWAAMGIKAGTEAAVQESQLPPEQKQRVIASINQVADDFKSGKVSTDQLGKVMQEVMEGPVLPVGLVMAAESKYVIPSGLTTEEKDGAKRTLQRLARGIYEKKITDTDLDPIVQPITKPRVQVNVSGTGKPNRDWQFKESATDAEVKDFLTRAKAKVDEKQVPDEAYNVNVADELDKAIAKALGK